MPQQIGLVAILDMSQFNKGLDEYNRKVGEAVADTDKASKDIGKASSAIGVGWEEAARTAGVAMAGIGAAMTAIITKATLTAARTQEMTAVVGLLG